MPPLDGLPRAGTARASSPPRQGLALLADQVYEELLDAIVERRLPPGTRLIPGNLARDLGVSATPVKLALTRLIADGLVAGRSRRGVFVAQLESAQLEVIFEARLFLETGAARDYADRVTSGFTDELEQAARAYEELATTGGDHNRRQLGDLDRDFHRLIIRLANNEHITRWYEQANIHIQGHRLVVPRERYEATIREHEAIVHAFRRGSPDQMVDSLKQHLANAKAHLLLMLRTAGAQAPRVRRLRDHDATTSVLLRSEPGSRVVEVGPMTSD